MVVLFIALLARGIEKDSNLREVSWYIVLIDLNLCCILLIVSVTAIKSFKFHNRRIMYSHCFILEVDRGCMQSCCHSGHHQTPSVCSFAAFGPYSLLTSCHSSLIFFLFFFFSPVRKFLRVSKVGMWGTTSFPVCRHLLPSQFEFWNNKFKLLFWK